MRVYLTPWQLSFLWAGNDQRCRPADSLLGEWIIVMAEDIISSLCMYCLFISFFPSFLFFYMFHL